MLDRARLLYQIKKDNTSLFADDSDDLLWLAKLWKKVVQDEPDPLLLSLYDQNLAIPIWQENFATTYPVVPQKNYSIISVDGSQIYPDRHSGFACYLINIGSVGLFYDTRTKPVFFDSQPYFYKNDDLATTQSIAEINAQRQELEFQDGLKRAKIIREKDPSPLMILFDGSFIFWHLETIDLREKYLSSYLTSLQLLTEEKLLIASYISLPKSKDLVSILTAYSDQRALEKRSILRRAIDSCLVRFFLKPYERTIVFKSTVAITKKYATSIAPYFFYLHVGSEICRIEIPHWIATNQELLTITASCILDQALKGRGYPVALAEAHEQAVIKGPDRDFFYQLLTKISIEEKQMITVSAKSKKKRGIAI